MKQIWKFLVAAGVLAVLATPVVADESKGEVREIIVKIDTPDGPRWYSLGADISKIDIHKGSVVRFNYEDDLIDDIEIEEVSPDAPAAENQ